MTKFVKAMGILALIAGFALAAGPAMAASQDALENRIQTLEQALTGLKAQLHEVKVDQAEETKLPGWVKRMKFYGDVRFRYENTTYDDTEVNGVTQKKDDRDRLRVRFRFGVKSQIHDDVELGFRIATGSDDDATSTNQTMGDYWGEYTSLGIDRVYVKWTPGMIPGKPLWLGLGKMKNPFVTSKVIFDGDVVPEGVFGGLHFNKKGAVQPFITAAFFYLEEHKNDQPDDLYGYAAQAGVKGKAGAFKYTLATTYYDWGKLGEAGQIPPNVHGNTEYTDLNGDSRLSSFKVWDLYGKASFKVAKKTSIGAWGHYLNNTDADIPNYVDARDKDTAWGAGAYVAYSAFKLHVWYKYVEANATPGFIADSDSGFVNMKTWVVAGSWKIWKYGKLKLSYFMGEPVDTNIGSTSVSNEYNTFFIDFVLKF